MFSFAYPWVLILLPLALAPFFARGAKRIAYPWLALVPDDRLSRFAGFALRLAGALIIVLLLLGLAGLYRGGRVVEQTVEGAQVVIVLDRSRSMNDTFAGESPATGEESKARAASRLLLDFVNERPENVYGMVEFSTSPIYVMPLTIHIEAVRAAIRAAGAEGLALTAMSGALGMSAGFFAETADQGSRVILLVSDGAAKLDPRAADLLRQWFNQHDLRLYWIYMRTEGSPGIRVEGPQELAPVGGYPEQALHAYFKSLGVPYRAYEADNPAAMRRAVADIDDLERLPLQTRVTLPRQTLSNACFKAAFVLLLALIAARSFELRQWR